MNDVGNWGRWGPEDERGTLNLVTEDRVLTALTTVKRGTVLSLGMPIKAGTAASSVPHLRHRPLPQHFMASDAGDYAAGARGVYGEMAMSDDSFLVAPHGTTTHLDALAHAWRGDSLYNGHPASTVRSRGAGRCGIENVGGVVTRGVLLDIARLHGVDHLAADVRIDRQMLLDAQHAIGVEVGPGDVVLIRTGWPRVFADDPARYQGEQPGLAHDAGIWLADRDVAIVGSDNAAVGAIGPDGVFDADVETDLHLLFLWQRGIHLLEMLWLEDLGEREAATFLFMASPLALHGGTGGPVNPVAVL